MTKMIEELLTDVVRRDVPLGELIDRLQDIRAEARDYELLAGQALRPVSSLIDSFLCEFRRVHQRRDDVISWLQDLRYNLKQLEQITVAVLTPVQTVRDPAFSH